VKPPGKNETKVSLTLLASIGVLMSVLSLVLFLLFEFIASNFSPSFSNAERYLRQGKLEHAMALARDVPGETARKAVLRGRIFLAFSIQGHAKDMWSRYGTDSLDWLKGPMADSAVTWFKIAKLRDPSYAEARYYLGVVYKEKGWLREAEEELLETLKLDPANIDARLALGSLYPRMDLCDDAAQHLLDAWRLSPSNSLIAKNLAFLYRFYRDNPESAIVWYNRYLNDPPPGDIDINSARLDLSELLDRYPEYSPEEKQLWRRQPRRFIPRYHGRN